MKKVTLALFLLSTLSFSVFYSQSNLFDSKKATEISKEDSLKVVSENIDTLASNDTIAIGESIVSNESKTETKEASVDTKKALVSWYGGYFHGRLTASGKKYNMNELTAAHKTLPFGTKVKIINPKNGKEVIVTVTDRGPYVKKREFDLSRAAFAEISSLDSGILNIKYEIL